VVEHVRVAVLCFDENNKVELSNKAAKELFQKDHITSLTALAKVSQEVASKIEELKSGERELVKVKVGGTLLNLSLQVTTFKLQGKDYKLVSFQDIKSELEEKEIESWQRLIRVLTHEIKNSVIPISTLSEVILQVFKKEVQAKSSSQTEVEAYQDIVGGLETIEARSKGLAHFVKTYDQLTKVSKPELSTVQLLPLVKRIENLFKPDLEAENIDFQIDVDSTIEINADPNLLDQVLINLVKNAIEAIKNQPYKSIQLSTRIEQDKVILSIRDNGPGIPDEVLDNIFVPFYTTKQSGSGIGLSLSRQIMVLHKGSIAVKSSSEGTSFELIF
jgi:signal transduction histidine kinase